MSEIMQMEMNVEGLSEDQKSPIHQLLTSAALLYADGDESRVGVSMVNGETTIYLDGSPVDVIRSESRTLLN